VPAYRCAASGVAYVVGQVAQGEALKDSKIMSLAKKIVDLRKERNLTQKELAKSIGVHFSHISRYERGISLPSIDVVKKIAQVFSVSTDYLLLDNDQVCLATTISDPELLALFEAVSQMPEQEQAAIKIVLGSMVVKHQIEQLLKERTALLQAPSLLSATAAVSPWEPATFSARLRQHVDGTVDNL
jgi:transcriptional regulator with XRE-family HTH domain